MAGTEGAGSIFEYTPTAVQRSFVSGLSRPRGLAFDSAGNLFVATTSFDGTNFQTTILKITPGGAQSSFGSLSSNLFGSGLAIDNSDDVFVVAQDVTSGSPFPSTIFKFTPDGTQSTFGSLPGQSFGLAFDSAGNLFAADSFDQVIYEFTPLGEASVFVGPSAFTSVQGPTGLAFDRLGNLFVSTAGNPGGDAILKFTPGGAESTIATNLNNPRGIAFNTKGKLFVAELNQSGPGDILEFTSRGNERVVASGIGDANGNGGPEWLSFFHHLQAW
jgi:sugar lactone lactonase YvrE